MITEADIWEIVYDLHAKLLKTWSKKEQNLFFFGPYTDQSQLIQYHSTLGRYIRNEYKLWDYEWTSEICDGEDRSPYHPDNLSFEIIKRVWKLGPNKVENG